MKRYEPCGYVVEMYPAWKVCGRPVSVESGKIARCPEHRARLPYWPASDDCPHKIPGSPAVCPRCQPRPEPQTPRRLPVIKINGERYFVDERLREYRSVSRPWDAIPFEQAP